MRSIFQMGKLRHGRSSGLPNHTQAVKAELENEIQQPVVFPSRGYGCWLLF